MRCLTLPLGGSKAQRNNMSRLIAGTTRGAADDKNKWAFALNVKGGFVCLYFLSDRKEFYTRAAPHFLKTPLRAPTLMPLIDSQGRARGTRGMNQSRWL